MNELAATTPIVRQRGNQLFTTSIDVAEKFGKQHKNVLQAILALECSDEFNRLNFQPVKYVDEKGERRPMYHISRDGFSFLAMGFRGKKAAEWKEKYITAFNLMESALLRQRNLSWQDQRSLGRAARREVTDTIQAFIAYAEAQGSKNAHHYYKHVTTATYKALFIIKDQGGKSFRDLLDSMQLSFLTTAEYVAAKAIEDGMAERLFYKDIYRLAKERIESFATAIPRSNVIAMQASLPGRFHPQPMEAPA